MSTPRLKLLVLTSTFPRWQGDTSPAFVADLCEGLSETMDVTVLAPASHGARAAERWGGVTVRRFRYGWPASTQKLADGAILPNIQQNPLLMGQVPPFVLAELWAAWRLARRERFDAVHAHWAIPQGIVGAMLKRALGVPLLTTAHGGDIYALRSGPPRNAKRWALRESDAVTAVSSALKRDIVALGIDEKRVHVMPMGVDTDRFAPDAASAELRRTLAPDGPLLLFVGRLVEKKGARYAIGAMPEILRAEGATRLVIVGEGPERHALERQARRLGVRDAVTFAGAVPNRELPAYYASSDVFVGPSVVEANGDTESFGVAFAEAQASACAVVSSDVGGISDVVCHGETGVVVPQRNAEAVARAVGSLLEDRGLRERMGGRGRELMRDRLDHGQIHSRYAGLIREVAA